MPLNWCMSFMMVMLLLMMMMMIYYKGLSFCSFSKSIEYNNCYIYWKW